ncbi:helix-turn-helix transcriptional regulator [Photobacterium profundum]|uniref:helix-turn-helix transcriptional regulator n=1 Tax=Photobacterium TaxID=657 RepID=UPI000057B732|nr:hypothetical protein [Photobacterium profundum]
MGKGYMTAKEICEHYRFTRRTLDNKIKKNIFPGPDIKGGRNLWRIETIEEYESMLNKD